MGNAVNEPVLPLTSPLVNFSTYASFTRHDLADDEVVMKFDGKQQLA